MGSNARYLALAAVIVVAMGTIAVAARSGQPVAETAEPPRFVAETATGVDHVYDGDWSFFVGGGVAVFDCDDDGKPDLYLAGGVNEAALYRNRSVPGGAMSFTEVTDDVTGLIDVTGAYPLDVDSDGHTDLAVLRLGENLLLRGLGGCRFERANERWTFDGGDAWTTAFSAAWEGSAALPTLAFGNYVELDADRRSTDACSENVLVRPTDDETGYARPTPLAPGWCTLSVLFSDWDRSGRRDLRVSNDRHYYRDGEEQLWRVEPGARPRLYTRDEGWEKLQIWGMGIASQDLTGDGRPEVFLTSQGDNKLQTLVDGSGQPRYDDIAYGRGVTAHRPYAGGEALPSTAWHPEFQDVNNDGWLDLFVTKGNVEAMPEYASLDPNNLLVGQPDGGFVEGAEQAGIVSFARGRGAAVVDLDLDGLLDLIVVNRREPVEIWRNVGSGEAADRTGLGNWVAVRLAQPGPNRDAVGAWIEVEIGDRTLQRENTIGGGHAGGQLGWIHFGLGDQEQTRIRVRWPDGALGPWIALDANTYATVERGAPTARSWEPPDR